LRFSQAALLILPATAAGAGIISSRFPGRLTTRPVKQPEQGFLAGNPCPADIFHGNLSLLNRSQLVPGREVPGQLPSAGQEILQMRVDPARCCQCLLCSGMISAEQPLQYSSPGMGCTMALTELLQQ